jgi:hypothetical protein
MVKEILQTRQIKIIICIMLTHNLVLCYLIIRSYYVYIKKPNTNDFGDA